MAKSKGKNKGTSSRWLIVAIFAVLAGVAYFLFFSGMSRTGKEEYVLIDEDDNIDSVYVKLQPISTPQGFWVFKQLAGVMGYADNIRPGRFVVGSSGSLQTSRHIINGLQAPVKITIRSVRTIEDLAKMLVKN